MHSISHTSDKKSRLKRKLESVPEKPGVYLHKNTQNEILYVGKAKNLKNRLKSYFGLKDHQSHKTQALIEHIEDFDFILTQNEYESIVAENNLIKHHKPHYNILLKDSKTYPYLKINLNDPWPQLIFTRRKKDDGAIYFGPYSNVGDLDKILRVIQKFFPLIRCAKHTFKTVTRPCNYYHVGQCLAPCHLNVNREEYLETVQSVISLLKGKTKDVISKIKLEMKSASEQLNFEKAAKLRDSIKALESISYRQSVDLHSPINIDFIAFIEKNMHCVFYVSHIRDGILVGTDSFVHAMPKDISSDDVLSSLILQYYDTHQEPEASSHNREFSSQDHQDPTRVGSELFTFCINYDDQNLFLKKLKVKKETRNNILHLIDMTLENAQHKLEEKIKTHSSSYDKMLDVQKLLNLKQLPKRIECYDISTFQGTNTVGSRVVFMNGLPCKSLYRKYIIKEHPEKMDDFSSLKEVLRRRLKHPIAIENDDDHVDLLMVDGGTPQVREVARLLETMGLGHIFLVGLAKQRTDRNFTNTFIQTSQERLVVPARNANNELLPLEPPQTVELDPHSKAFQLLVSIRDEAHRFAITFHRKRRDKLAK